MAQEAVGRGAAEEAVEPAAVVVADPHMGGEAAEEGLVPGLSDAPVRVM